ncbi:DUF551 domain-containing protein [Actinobacillus equuli subsp. equuli]|uniref:DUF551 domain-containing protein n=1 Tax=Actinobacillus equuli subsp. equuli TaxID=202947 RepID=A0A9X4G4X4_ACTEU|nr:DUF551 domain-containing protein [Actinobacillus equuli]MDE8035312.1 DUF551 domain-containing protein [Actinobacillus equuli subsp. equuli]MDG4948389.1 DUF551 domain-containing protein [Actinobacillus equuli subsp. haemolyticus]
MTKENNGWISVKDKIIPKNCYILAYTSYGEVEMVMNVGDHESFVRHNLFVTVDNKDITHWQPLPQPPRD